jgi:hypothetical protein
MEPSTSFIPDAETPKLLEPAQGAFDDPTELAQVALVFRPPVRHDGSIFRGRRSFSSAADW